MLDSLKNAAELLAFPFILTAATGTLSYVFLDKYANGKGMQNADLLRGTAEYLKEYDGKAQNVAHHGFETVELVRSNNSHLEELSRLSRDLEERLASGQAMDTKELSEKMYAIVNKHDVHAEELIGGIGFGLLALISLAGTSYGTQKIIKDEITARKIRARLKQNEVRFSPDEIAKIRAEEEQRRNDSSQPNQ